MQKQYAKDGLVILSVSLDSPDDKAKVAQTLRAKQAHFVSLLLTAPNLDELQEKKLGFAAVPAVFVFNRQGKWTRFLAEDKKYAKSESLEPLLRDVDALVAASLKQK